MNRQRKEIIKNNEISEVCTVTLGGYPQKIMLDGRRKSNPVVICLHGGPGSPVPFSVGCRGLFPDITEKYTLVCWDQLGCGINNRPIDDSFRVEHFADMTVDLVREIRARFPDNRLYLFGMSWGSILAAKTALRAADMIDGVVIYGQVLRDLAYNDYVFEALERSSMPVSKKKKLKGMKNQRTDKNTKQIMGWIGKYTEGYTCKTGEPAEMKGIISGLMRSPDYRFRDFTAIVNNGYRRNKSLMTELFGVDLRQELAGVSVPYVIIQGDTDLVTPSQEVRSFISDCTNPMIRLVDVKHSGHIPGKEGMERILTELEILSAEK